MGTRARLITTAVALTVVAGVAPGAADAAHVRDCSGTGRHTADTSTASNVVTRKVACQQARLFIRRYDGPASDRSWRCYEYETSSFADIHCTRPGGRVIHWQSTWRRQR